MSEAAASVHAPPATRWGIVSLVVGAGVVAAFQVGKVPAAIPALRADLGMSLFTAGVLISLLNVIAVAGGMVAGVVADWFGHRRIAIAGLALIALANLLGALAPGTGAILASRFVEGLGFLVIVVAAPSLIVRAASAHDQKLAFGIWGAYVPVGITAILLISPLILSAWGWRGLWGANAGLAFIYAALLAFATRGIARRAADRPKGPPRPWRDIKRVISRPGPIALALCFTGYSGNWLAVLGFLPVFLIEQRGFGVDMAAALTAVAFGVNTGGNLLGGVLLHRGIPRWRLIAFSHATMVLTGFAIYSDAVPDWGRYGACLLFSCLSGVLPPSVFSGAPRHAPEPRLIGTTNGLIVQGSNLGQMIGPPILAALVGLSGGWQVASIFVASASTLGIGFALWLRRLEQAPAR